MLPSLIGLQPFLPGFLQTLVLYSRLIIGPAIIFYFLKEQFNFYIIGLFLFYCIILSVFNPPIDKNDFILIFLSLLSAIPFFKLGAYLKESKDGNNFFKFLIYGINIFNVITIIVYLLLENGSIEITSFFEIAGKQIVELFRFSIGNPIELPFVITLLLYSSIILVNEKSSFLFSTTLNLGVTIISQSRIVVLIAFLIFLAEFSKSKKKEKLITFVGILIFIPFLYNQFGDIVLSYFERISGNDFGSADDRKYLIEVVANKIDIKTFIFGNGLTSSSIFLKHTISEYRTVESIAVQFIFEFGIMGIFLFCFSLFSLQKGIKLPNKVNIILILTYFQLLVFLPIFTLFPFVFLAIGIISFRKTVLI